MFFLSLLQKMKQQQTIIINTHTQIYIVVKVNNHNINKGE